MGGTVTAFARKVNHLHLPSILVDMVKYMFLLSIVYEGMFLNWMALNFVSEMCRLPRTRDSNPQRVYSARYHCNLDKFST